MKRFSDRKKTLVQCPRTSKRRKKAPNCSFSFGNELPVELLLKTFRLLNVRDLFNCAVVCKYWATLVQDDSIWRAYCKKIVKSAISFSPKKVRLDNCKIRPTGVSSWREYHDEMKLFNEIRRLSYELVYHTTVTAGKEWKSVGFRLMENEERTTRLSCEIIRDDSEEAIKQGIQRKDYEEVVKALGVSESSRTLFWTQVYEELLSLLRNSNFRWDGHLILLQHQEKNLFDSPVEIHFINKNEEKSILSLKLSPNYFTMNSNVMHRVLGIVERVHDLNIQLRNLLTLKSSVCVDFGRSRLSLFNQRDDPSPIFVPFQIIGVFSCIFLSWKYGWQCEYFALNAYDKVLATKERSLRERWPEANLFNVTSLDCELQFALALAHLFSARMGTLLFPYTPSASSIKIYLGLDISALPPLN